MPKEEIQVHYLGQRSYNDVLVIQEEHFDRLLNEKIANQKSSSVMQLILCQHNPVYTLGKNGEEKNLLKTGKNSDAEFIHSSRGGDITFHGPGQLVGYPILDLERLNMGLAQYIENIEEAVVKTIAEYNLKGERYKGASGVWLDIDDAKKIRKICALGIRSSRWVTMHGFAFNINTDLTYFDFINPCGFTDKGVTTLEKEMGGKQDFESVMQKFIVHFSDIFNVQTSKEIEVDEKNS